MIKVPTFQINNEHDMEIALKRLIKRELFISVYPNHKMHSAFANMVIEFLHEEEKKLIQQQADQSSGSLKSNEDSSESS